MHRSRFSHRLAETAYAPARWLAAAGRHGPRVLFAGVFIGLAVPALAAAARPLMPLAVFVFTLGAFLCVERGAWAGEVARPCRFGFSLGWVVVGVPLVVLALASSLPLPEGARTALVLCALGPPVGSAAAMAAMLGLRPALALALTIPATMVAPLTLAAAGPLLGDASLRFDAYGPMARALAIVTAAALASALLRRCANSAIRTHPEAMRGLSVLGLVVVAVGAMHGMRERLAERPAEVAAALAIAFTANAALQALGAALFARRGLDTAMTVGLVSGNRNVTLVWVAVMPWLDRLPGVELYLAAAVFPIFTLPLCTARLLACARNRFGARPAGRPTSGGPAPSPAPTQRSPT